jgi:hypothetical protein
MKIGVYITTSYIFVKYSHQHGDSSLLWENGKAIRLEEPIHQWLIEMRKIRKDMLNLILMIDGSITHNIELVYSKEHRLYSV